MNQRIAESRPEAEIVRGPARWPGPAGPAGALRFGVVGIVYAASAVVSLLVCAVAGATRPVPPLVVPSLAAGFVIALLAARGDAVRRAATTWAWLLTLLSGASLYLAATHALPARPYGDSAIFARFVEDGGVVPRWLAGSALATRAYTGVWTLSFVQEWVPDGWRSGSGFLALLGTLTMVAGTWALHRRWPGRLSVLLPTLTPIWVLFATGYVEYYPLIAAPIVGALAWLCERPLEQRSPAAVGALAGFLPVLYVGFAPIGAATLGAYALARRASAIRAVVVAALVATTVVLACWPDGPEHFVTALRSVMNVGDAHLPPQYAGQVAGPDSIMFSVQAAVSSHHARELGYLLAWGGGWWLAPMLVLAGARASVGRLTQVVRGDAARICLVLTLILWQVYYFVFMVPRLGPAADVDLFFSTYLVVAFAIGWLFDVRRTDDGSTWAPGVVAVALAALACAAPWLAWAGLPPAP